MRQLIQQVSLGHLHHITVIDEQTQALDVTVNTPAPCKKRKERAPCKVDGKKVGHLLVLWLRMPSDKDCHTAGPKQDDTPEVIALRDVPAGKVRRLHGFLECQSIFGIPVL